MEVPTDMVKSLLHCADRSPFANHVTEDRLSHLVSVTVSGVDYCRLKHTPSMDIRLYFRCAKGSRCRVSRPQSTIARLMQGTGHLDTTRQPT